MNLTETQQRAVDLVSKGRNVFISGSAGTGKSFTIERIKEEFPHVHLTASTGIAAINIGGETLHRWSGIKPDHETVEDITKKMYWKTAAKLQHARALLIDEVSMVSGNMIDLLDKLLKYSRRNERAFGGIQLIVVGDFLQLPPVGDDEPFCFESEAWHQANFENVKLEKVFRQEKDTRFIDFLTKMRTQKLEKEDYEQFINTCSKERPTDDYVRLFPTNYECDKLNNINIMSLKDPAINFKALWNGDNYEVNLFFKNGLYKRNVILKKGARVMMLSNKHIDLGVANGSTGTVIKLNSDGVRVQFDNGEKILIEKEFITIRRKVDGEVVTVASITQIPLRLSWAITIHKSQGMSLDKVYCDFTKIFTYSQVYVALSRARDMENLFIKNFNSDIVKFHPKALEFNQR